MRIASCVVCVLVLSTLSSLAAPPDEFTIELRLRGKKIEGFPVTWNPQEVVVLGRDGRIWQFTPEEASDFRKVSDRFQGYSASELRATLLRELGNDYEVSGTGHYMVAHPKGQGDQWAERFEELHRSFVRYFSVRNIPLREPPFLLVGVVCRDRQDFVRHAEGGAPGQGVLGYYSNLTNRILLYDLGNGGSGEAYWQKNASVVVHEATHQLAFNAGLHNRYHRPPVWTVEGLATMFEPVALNEQAASASPKDRVNRQRWADFQKFLSPRHKPEILSNLIANDHLFKTVPGAAYAEAWALTFYLVETQPKKYLEYMMRVAARPAFEDYTAAERTADFTSVFGSDWRMLESRLLRFIADLAE